MVLKILFWLAFGVDVCIVGLIFVLGLAAAGPSHTNPLEVVFKLLILPALVLSLLAFWFVRVPAAASRLAALLVAASPFILFLAGGAMTGVAMLLNPEEAKRDVSFRPVPLTDLQNAILANDLQAVRTTAAAANLKRRTDTAGLAMISLDRIAKSPDQVPVLQALLDAGLNPDQSDGALPLERAIDKRLPTDVLVRLIRAGANPNRPNQLGDPVIFAAAKPEVDIELLRALLDHGGDPNARSFRGETLLARAQSLRNQQAVELLLNRGAK